MGWTPVYKFSVDGYCFQTVLVKNSGFENVLSGFRINAGNSPENELGMTYLGKWVRVLCHPALLA